MFEDDLPPGYSVVSLGGGSPPPAPMPSATAAEDDLPEGYRVISRGSTLPKPAPAPSARPHADARMVLGSLYPTAKMTDWQRDPSSPLGRANPSSWHNRSKGALDVAPISGMTFDQYVGGYRKAGYPIIEARDEVNNPAAHATGPHWHVVLGERPGEDKLQMPPKLNPDAPPVTAGFQPGPKVTINGEDPAPLVSTASHGRAFFDELPEAVASKLSPQDVGAWQALARDMKSTPDQLRQFMKARGFDLHTADEIVKARNEGAGVTEDITYKRLDPIGLNDGATGATMRGVADSFNVLDETGAVFDTLGLTKGRKNIWNSELGIRDLLNSNIDANRAVLEGDAKNHGEARFLGQLGSGLLLPIGGGARTAAQIAKYGAAEGAVAGFGAGEGNPLDRAPNAAVGSALGAAGGYALGRVIDDAAPLVRGMMARRRASRVQSPPVGAYEAAPVVNDAVQASGPTPAARTQPQGGVVGRNDNGPTVRQPEAVRQQIVESNQMASDLHDAWRAGKVTPDPAKLDETIQTQELAFSRGEIPGDMRKTAEGTLAFLKEIRGAVPQGGPRAAGLAAMDSGIEAPTLTGPRVRDRIDVKADDVPEGYRVVGGPDIGPLTPRQQFRPENVLPIPGNRVDSLDEFQAATGGIQQRIKAPDPYKQLRSRDIPVRGRPGEFWQHKGPIDAEAFLRRSGGLRDDGGNLAAMGITNAARAHNRGEGRLGRLVDNENGQSLDDAAFRLWEAGYFPDHHTRPDINDLLDVLAKSRNGNRTFHPDDFDEVDRFNSATADAHRIGEADQAGSPLYEDRGQSIGPDDLAKLTPPNSAYEDAPRMVGRVGNLNLEHVDNPEEVSRLVQHIRANVAEIDGARGATVTNEELKQLARDLNVTPERILKWNKGSLPSPAEVFASRVIVHQGRQKIKDLARRARGASDEDLAKFHNVVMKQAALERQLAGMAADAGRLLQQFNATAAAGDMSDAAIKAYLRGAGGRETVEEIADKLIDLVEDPSKAGRFIQGIAKASKLDMVNELYINSLLSGVPTHLVNFGGNGFMALLTVPEEALTAAVGMLTRSADRAHLRDVGARVVGMMEGAREGLALMRQTFKTGNPSDAVSKVEARNYQAIPGKLGHFLRTPTRALSAADEFWGAMHRRGALNSAAMRRALNSEGTRAEKMARYAELRDNPDDALIEYARTEALYRTFRKELGAGGKAVQRLSNDLPLMKLVIPFVRTPINIIKYAGERSPLSVLAPSFYREMRAGGAQRDAALAKLTMGAGLSAWAVEATLNGQISGGGPTDPGERASLAGSGWKPYSIKVGDTWVSYQRFEPLSLIIGATADFAEAGKMATTEEGDKIALNIAVAIAKNLTSKTWMSGLSDFFEVLSDPQRYGKRYAHRMAGTLAVPAVFGNAARAVDPNVREVNSVLDAIKNRIPFLSHDLTIRRDVWGEPLERGNGAGKGVGGSLYNYVSPVIVGTMSKDPVRREMARVGAVAPMPQRSIRVAGVNTRLSPEQYSYYVQLSGMPAKSYLAGFIQSPEWRAMTIDEKRDHVKETMEEFRAMARDELRSMFPELAGEADELPPGFKVVR